MMRIRPSLASALVAALVACAQEPRAAPPQLDVVRIEMERGTLCSTDEPAYRLSLGRDGDVTYRGAAYVWIEGEAEGRMPVEAFVELAREFERVDFTRREPILETGTMGPVALTLHLADGRTFTMSAALVPHGHDDPDTARLRAWIRKTAGRIDALTDSRRLWVDGA